jgi:hypothetical protein
MLSAVALLLHKNVATTEAPAAIAFLSNCNTITYSVKTYKVRNVSYMIVVATISTVTNNTINDSQYSFLL